MAISDGGAAGEQRSNPVPQQIALLSAVVAIAVCWPLERLALPIDSRFAFVDLMREHWTHRNHLEPWLDQRWAWLAVHSYHLWFALAGLPGVVAASIVQSVDRRTVRPLFYAPFGWASGAVISYLLYGRFCAASWPLAVMMPATLALLCGAIASRSAVLPRKIKHLRGTRVRTFSRARIARLCGRLAGGVALAGVSLSREDETMHVAAIGATGSGKSTALRGLMGDAIRRGDRHVVADPDGASLSAFFQSGDVILNPFDQRCARWDLLGEIEKPSDYAFLARSLLPHIGAGDHDQWISYAQQLLAGAMENFHALKLGSSADFATMLAKAKLGEFKQLCAGTSAARYFEEGGDRMLASILGTLSPVIGHLRLTCLAEGEPFTIRRWIREGAGSLWMPYAANQIAAINGLISSWMNIAIVETLSLEPSRDRRIWFHIDELDALGRIEGLKDAQARLRKFGGCVAIGFQSFAQVKQVYGESAQTIVENCGNLLLLRAGMSGDGGTAKLVSQLIGCREVERDDESRSWTNGRFTTRSNSMQTRRVIEEVALTSEITQLPNRDGFLKRATGSDWQRVRFPYADYAARVQALVPSEHPRNTTTSKPLDSPYQ